MGNISNFFNVDYTSGNDLNCYSSKTLIVLFIYVVIHVNRQYNNMVEMFTNPGDDLCTHPQDFYSPRARG